jgi:4-hydroxyproline epimerase
MHQIHVIDSHTGGEPTRVVVSGGPDLGDGPLKDRLERFRVQHDRFRSAVVNEPRGSDAMVGALICQPNELDCAAGVIFFNNVSYLGMCGHGSIGLAATLAHMGHLAPGVQRIDTPAGVVTVDYHGGGVSTVGNVASYRLTKQTEVHVPGIGKVRGDVAWGGNWFYLIQGAPVPLTLDNLDELTQYTWRIRQALSAHGIAGAGGAEIDHIELFGPPSSPDVADSRNFVLCPGKAYDRSPCGTGTSAKMACLYADGKLAEGQTWRQESIVGSVFEGRIEVRDGKVMPYIRGSAFINSEARLILDENDPFCWGIRQ